MSRLPAPLDRLPFPVIGSPPPFIPNPPRGDMKKIFKKTKSR